MSHEIIPSESTAREIYQIESIYNFEASDNSFSTIPKARAIFENQVAGFLSRGNIGNLEAPIDSAKLNFSFGSNNAQGEIRSLRARLKINQSQPFVWSELARSYIKYRAE